MTLNENERSSIIFTDTHDDLHCNDFHNRGCTWFVLKEANQSGLTGTPKWEPRGRAGVYLRHSTSHSGNVALVLNMLTSHVSPQYHIVFDDDFTTVDYIQSGEDPPNWCKLVTDSSEHVTHDQYDLSNS